MDNLDPVARKERERILKLLREPLRLFNVLYCAQVEDNIKIRFAEECHRIADGIEQILDPKREPGFYWVVPKHEEYEYQRYSWPDGRRQQVAWYDGGHGASWYFANRFWRIEELDAISEKLPDFDARLHPPT